MAFTFPSSAPTTETPTRAPTTSAPTGAPTTRAPTRNGRRLLATTSTTITDWQNTTSLSSCKTDDYYFQRRFGVEMGILLVHDLYFVSFKTSGASLTRTQRLTVRAANQQLAFTASATSFSTSNTAWFAKYGSIWLQPSFNARSIATANFGMSNPYYFSVKFEVKTPVMLRILT